MPTIRRTLKNVVKNYSDAQVKVREATSNDPWGPSSTLMSEIADLTFNVVAFTEIMQMVWKRLNDDGKHWRHVYKSLVLLDYIIKTGSEKVAQQCKENFHAIKTLTSFQHIDIDNKDQGMNVREKAKQLVALLSDDERLKNERAKALKAKERFAQNAMGVGSSGPGPAPGDGVRLRNDRASPTMHATSGGYTDPYGGAMAGYNDSSPGSGSGGTSSEMENARPASAGEEELQLQLALAMSKEEHDEEVRRLKSDEMKLQMALEQSRKTVPDEAQPKESLLDLSNNTTTNASAGTRDPWGMPTNSQQSASASRDPWGAPLPTPQQVSDPWGAQVGAPAASHTTPSVSAPLSSQPPPAPVAGTDAWGMALASPSGTSPQAYSGTKSDAWSRSPIPQAGGGDGAFGNNSGLDAFGTPAANGTNGTSTVDNEFDLLSSRSNEASPSKLAGGMGGDEFDLLSGGGSSGGNAWNMSGMQQGLPDPSRKKSPEDFLGANANLVNLDQLVAKAPPKGNNPFALTGPGSSNPFQDAGSSSNSMAMAQISPVNPGFSQPIQSGLLPTPIMPMNSPQQPLQPQNNAYNPFL